MKHVNQIADSELRQLELFSLSEKTAYEMVKATHKKFGIDYTGDPRHLEAEEKAFRVVCLREEIDEYEEAKSKEDELDALIDVIFFALGTLERHGYPFTSPFIKVTQANMAKKLAKASNVVSKRSFDIDLIKPDGWKAPDMSEFVGEE